jgi:acyl phosphate:glycerol-3-phosphate acyltransferase
MSWADVLLKIVLAYLLGSLSGSLLLGRLRGIDVRRLGSGNAGGTNAFRTQGWRFALGVVLIDVGKAVLVVWIAQRGVADAALALRLGMAGGAACVLGHVWPIFFGFKGGKGAATLIGAMMMLWMSALPPLLLVWILSMMITGYVGLSTMLAGIALLPWAWWMAPADERTLWLGAAACIAMFLVYTHRSNLLRMRTGNEYRFERIRLIGRWLDGKQ